MEWCPGAESNHRHRDFQSRALPTELPGRTLVLLTALVFRSTSRLLTLWPRRCPLGLQTAAGLGKRRHSYGKRAGTATGCPRSGHVRVRGSSTRRLARDACFAAESGRCRTRGGVGVRTGTVTLLGAHTEAEDRTQHDRRLVSLLRCAINPRRRRARSAVGGGGRARALCAGSSWRPRRRPCAAPPRRRRAAPAAAPRWHGCPRARG
jgi:hypothetical protein